MMFTRAATEATMIALEADLWVNALRTASAICWGDQIWNLSTEAFETTASLTDEQLNDRETYNVYCKCDAIQTYKAGTTNWFIPAVGYDGNYYMPKPEDECWGSVYGSLIASHPLCSEVDLDWSTVFPNPSLES